MPDMTRTQTMLAKVALVDILGTARSRTGGQLSLYLQPQSVLAGLPLTVVVPSYLRQQNNAGQLPPSPWPW